VPPEVEAYLVSDANPWWQGRPAPSLPEYRRWLFPVVLDSLTAGLAPVTALRGPRQVGKSTLMAQVIEHLLTKEHVDPRRIFHVQFDEVPSLKGLSDPILGLSRWYENRCLDGSFNAWARKGEPALLFFDEVQKLPDWAPQVKSLVDHHSVRVFLTGSSSLQIEAGRDSLAGRISTLEMGPMLLREIAALRGFGHVRGLLPVNGLAPLKDKQFWLELRHHGEANRAVRDAAYTAFSERGGFPFAHLAPERPWETVADQLNETIVRRVIQTDLARAPSGNRRDEHLLEAVFRLACRYCGQAPNKPLYIGELHDMLGVDVGWQKLVTYLKFLDGTLLLRLVEPLELRLKRGRGPAKVCLCDHALRASWLQEVVPLAPAALQDFTHLSELAGRVAESTVGYFFASMYHLDVAHFPGVSEESEVDFVLTVGTQRIPVEVKYRRKVEFRDTYGLRRFIEQAHNNAPFGVLVTLTDDVASDDPRIVTLPLSSLLLLR
jgi:predicted AAA+ superfamily ATPase